MLQQLVDILFRSAVEIFSEIPEIPDADVINGDHGEQNQDAVQQIVNTELDCYEYNNGNNASVFKPLQDQKLQEIIRFGNIHQFPVQIEQKKQQETQPDKT
jgi:hypothetical protein